MTENDGAETVVVAEMATTTRLPTVNGELGETVSPETEPPAEEMAPPEVSDNDMAGRFYLRPGMICVYPALSLTIFVSSFFLLLTRRTPLFRR